MSTTMVGGSAPVTPRISIEEYISWRATRPTPFSSNTLLQTWTNNGILYPLADPTLRKDAAEAIELNYKRLELNPAYILPWANETIVMLPSGPSTVPTPAPITSTPFVPPAVSNTTSPTIYSNYVKIEVPANDRSGYFGGLHIKRDASNIVGGNPGEVNVANYIYSIVGARNKAFEWNSLAKLDNYAKEGQNVAHYAQANKFAEGPTWARCAETCSTDPLDGGQITDEVDVWISGPDNGNRGCTDYVVGDGKFIRSNGAQKSDVAEATFGTRVAACLNTPWAKFIFGHIVSAFKECGILLDSVATRAIWLRGKYIVGLDFSTAECQSAIRLAPGQRMTFEPTDQISWSWLNGRLRVQNGSINVLEIDTTTGDIYKKGVKVL